MWTPIPESQMPQVAAILDGVRALTVTNKEGQIVSETKQDIATKVTLESWTATEIDERGRPTTISYSDGTSIKKVYNCCHLDSETDRQGITSTYVYERNKSVNGNCTRLGDH